MSAAIAVLAGSIALLVALWIIGRGLFGNNDCLGLMSFVDALIGSIYGKPGSATDIAAEMNQIRTRIDNFGRIAFPGYERFEAWTQCPSCDRIAVHQIRTPKPAPIRGPLRVIENGDGTRSEIRTFNGMTTTGPDESVYETIRTCECGQEWGQR